MTIIKSLRDSRARGALSKGEPWALAHVSACEAPRPGKERAIVGMAESITAYAHTMDGSDGVLSPGIGDMLHGFLTLLNGDIGRLDGGTCDTWARNVAAAVDWNLDLSEMEK